MAEKDAKVRLNLAASGFLTQLKQLQDASKEFEHAVEGIGGASQKTSTKMGAFGSAAKAGFGAAKSSLAELGSSLKSTLTMAATLGGALSLAGSARGAIEMKDVYRDIAFGLQAGTEKAVTWQSVQTQIEGTAGRWKQSNKDVADTYAELASRMNSASKASTATEEIAKAALAGVAPMAQLTRIATSLTEQFGIKPEGLGDGLAQVVALSRKAKMPIEELEPKMAQLGATAKTMGLQGAEGLTKMMGMLVLASGTGKNARQTFTEISDLFTKLADPATLKEIGVKTHMKLEDHGVAKNHVMEMIIAKTGGKREELAKLFSGADLQLVSAFGKIYKEAADKTTGDLKKKTDAGLAALEQGMKAAGKTSFDAAEVEKQATENREEASAAFRDAMNKLENAFTKPEMIEAIDKLAQALPKLATAIADMLGWAVDHPKSAVAAAVGVKVGAAVLPAVAGSLGGGLLKGAWGLLKAGGGKLVGGAATAGEGAGAVVGAGAAATAAAAAAAAVGVGAAAYEGVQLHKMGKADGGVWKTIKGAFAGTLGGHADTPEEYDRKQAKARGLNAAVASVLDKHGPGGGKTDKATESLVALDKGSKSAAVSTEKVGQSFNRLADVADRVSTVLSKYDSGGGGSGTNGLPPNPGDLSGSAPR